MLSYFLGGGGGGIADSSLAMPSDFTSIHPHLHDEGDDHHHDHDIEIIMEEKEEEEHKGNGTLKSEDHEDDDSFVPPPTPLAPQFYNSRRSGLFSDNASKSPASDASLTTMAQTLISGGPVVQYLAPVPSSMSLTSLSSSGGQHQSPLSPALMLSHQSQSQENLLLPPEHVNTAAQHRAWLQELNARALAARQSQMAMAATVQQYQQQHASTHHPSMPPPPSQQSATQMQQQHAGQPFGHAPAYPMGQYMPGATQLWMATPNSQNATGATHIPMSAAATAAAMTPAESEEKRAKRLERNRESARKSRRKKKERLESLEAAVQLMQSKIAAERLVQMAGMVAGLQAKRRAVREHFDMAQAPRIAMRESGPQSSIFQSVVDFSYTALKLDLLPPYQKFWLWMGWGVGVGGCVDVSGCECGCECGCE